MKENEIRIGNLIRIKGKTDPVEVEHILFVLGIYRINDLDIIHYEPIPITEEWFKTSFTFAETFTCWFDDGKVYVEQYGEGVFELKHIKYVHQLQNLYFALTGEELTIKTK